MRKAEREERSHGVVQSLPVSSIQLCKNQEDERERDVLKEVGVAANSDFKRVRAAGGCMGWR